MNHRESAKLLRIAEKFKVSRRTVQRWLKEGEVNLNTLYEEIRLGEWEQPKVIAGMMGLSLSKFHRLLPKFNHKRVGNTIRINIKLPYNVSSGNNYANSSSR